MRRHLGTMAVTAALALASGCGSASSTASGGPASDPAGHPSRTPGPLVGARVLPLISMTGGGGTEASPAAPLDSPAEIARFAQQFPMPGSRHRIRAAIAQVTVPAGFDLVGQVVSVGCDRPPGVSVVVDKTGQVQLLPRAVASPLQECLVAVTTVALAEIPAQGG